MENREHQESNDVLSSVKRSSAYKQLLMAINSLELGEYDQSLACVNALEAMLVEGRKDAQTVDEINYYLYVYLLECNSFFERNDYGADESYSAERNTEFLSVVKQKEETSLAYKNITALWDWFTQDSTV